MWDKAAREARGPDTAANLADDPAALAALLAAEPKGNRRNNRGAAPSSRFRGVSWAKKDRRWRAAIKHRGKARHLGSFALEAVAARAYNRAARELKGARAVLNAVDEAEEGSGSDGNDDEAAALMPQPAAPDPSVGECAV